MRCQRLFSAMLFVALSAASANAATITFNSVTVNPLDSFDIQVRVLNVTDLFTFGFDLAYDPSIVSVVDITEGPFLRTPANAGDADKATFFIPGDLTTAGIVSQTSGSLFDPNDVGTTGSGVLAIIRFTALAAGDAGLALMNVLLLDSTFPVGNVIETGVENGAANVVGPTVPEPASMALLGLGLFGLVRRFS